MASQGGFKNKNKVSKAIQSADKNLQQIAKIFKSLNENLSAMMKGTEGIAYWSGEEAYAFYKIGVSNNNNNLLDYEAAYKIVEAVNSGLWKQLNMANIPLDSKNGATVKKLYTLNKPSETIKDSAIVDTKAKDYKSKIEQNYKDLTTYFGKISDDLKQIKKYSKGTGFTKELGKAATRCTNQAKFCTNRRNQLNEYFKYGQYEARLSSLEAKLAALNSSGV